MRPFLLPLLLAASGMLIGCEGRGARTAVAAGDFTHVESSTGVQQTISNCWAMASMGWIETLARRPNHTRPVDLSEGYVSYLHWIVQLKDDPQLPVREEGTWGRAVELSRRYGWLGERQFLSQASATPFAQRHAQAFAKLQTELRTGELSSREQREDPANVVKVMNRVWDLSPEIAESIVRVFGPGLERTLLDDVDLAGTPLHRLEEISIGAGPNGVLTAADAIGEPEREDRPFNGHRIGDHAFSEVDAPENDSELPAFFDRAKKALVEELPLPMAFLNDETALDPTGTFQRNADGYARWGPSHLVVAFDMAVATRDFGLLPAGVAESRAEARAAVLQPDSRLVALRFRNSDWGSYDKAGQTIPSVGVDGENDATIEFLTARTRGEHGKRVLEQLVLPNDPDAFDASTWNFP